MSHLVLFFQLGPSVAFYRATSASRSVCDIVGGACGECTQLKWEFAGQLENWYGCGRSYTVHTKKKSIAVECPQLLSAGRLSCLRDDANHLYNDRIEKPSTCAFCRGVRTMPQLSAVVTSLAETGHPNTPDHSRFLNPAHGQHQTKE